MKGWKKVLTGVIIGGSILASTLIPGCNKEAYSSHYIVDEWAVMEGCSSSGNFTLKGVPEQKMIVKQPIVYIRSEGEIKDLDLSVKISELAGEDSVYTYPKTGLSGSEISWKDIKVTNSLDQIQNPKESSNQDLDSLLSTLNNVDSNTLEYNSLKSKFLFYEAAVNFENPVQISYDRDKVVIKNVGKYALENLVFSAEFPSNESPVFGKVYFATAGKLAPNEEVSLPLSEKAPDYEIFKQDLLNLGFSEKEAESFVNVWGAPLLSPSLRGVSAQLVFRIPEDVYNKILPLSATPSPAEVNRAMYVAVDVNSGK